jgi:hypothetical protein
VDNTIEVKVDRKIGKVCRIRSTNIPKHQYVYCRAYADKMIKDLKEGEDVIQSVKYFGDNASDIVNVLSWEVIQRLLAYNRSMTTKETHENNYNFFIVDPDVLRDLTSFQLTPQQRQLKFDINNSTFYMVFRTPEFAFTNKMTRSLFAEIITKRTSQGLPTAIVSAVSEGGFYTALGDQGRMIKNTTSSSEWNHLKNFV